MKNLFGKKNTDVSQPEVDNTTNPPMASNMPKMQNPPPPPPPIDIPDKQWKSFNGNSCGEVTDFMNLNNVDPKFMISGANGQIRVFYKA